MAAPYYKQKLPTVDFGELNPKQKQFCQARSRYVGYGGARGGGKSHVLRIKALGGALTYPDIRILIVRREYPELEQGIIIPMRKMIPAELATYNGGMHMFTFYNGAIIKFGHYGSGDDVEYQGQEYDWIFIDEATQFTEEQFRTLGACLRGATKIPRRMYLTCNPGGIGHAWVKRLFIDREYQDGEKEKDYTFIHATVDDNPQLLEASPEYKQMLDLLPEDVRRAWRYGDWDALAGTFFPEFRKETHVIEPFARIPGEWKKYRAFDYGLDMFACLWIAVDFEGRCYVYREVQQSGLIVSEAAALILSLTPPEERIEFTIAPPDMWNRQKDSGKNMAELFAQNGVGLLRASNNRVQGWAAEKEILKPLRGEKDRPGLLVTSDCRALIRNIMLIQHDEKNPSDCATEPHNITHINDALRYEYANAKGKMAVSSYTPTGFAKGAMRSVLPIDSYILYTLTSDRDHSGGTDSTESAQTLQSMPGLTNSQRGTAWQEKNSTTKAEKNPFTGALSKAGVSPETAIKVLGKYRDLYRSGGKAKDKVTEFKDYLYSLGLTPDQMAVVGETFAFFMSIPAKW